MASRKVVADLRAPRLLPGYDQYSRAAHVGSMNSSVQSRFVRAKDLHGRRACAKMDVAAQPDENLPPPGGRPEWPAVLPRPLTRWNCLPHAEVFACRCIVACRPLSGDSPLPGLLWLAMEPPPSRRSRPRSVTIVTCGPFCSNTVKAA